MLVYEMDTKLFFHWTQIDDEPKYIASIQLISIEIVDVAEPNITTKSQKDREKKSAPTKIPLWNRNKKTDSNEFQQE